jgi:hypothetical protein
VIRQRTPEERVAYVEGFAAGWKAVVRDYVGGMGAAESALDELDRQLDVLSAVENQMRERETSPSERNGVQ